MNRVLVKKELRNEVQIDPFKKKKLAEIVELDDFFIKHFRLIILGRFFFDKIAVRLTTLGGKLSSYYRTINNAGVVGLNYNHNLINVVDKIGKFRKGAGFNDRVLRVISYFFLRHSWQTINQIFVDRLPTDNVERNIVGRLGLCLDKIEVSLRKFLRKMFFKNECTGDNNVRGKKFDILADLNSFLLRLVRKNMVFSTYNFNADQPISIFRSWRRYFGLIQRVEKGFLRRDGIRIRDSLNRVNYQRQKFYNFVSGIKDTWFLRIVDRNFNIRTASGVYFYKCLVRLMKDREAVEETFDQF